MQALEVTRLEVAAGIDAISGIAAETRALRAAAQAPGVMRTR